MLIDNLLKDARPGLTQAPDMAILAALRRAAARFCRESHVWQEQLDDVATQIGVAEYDLEAPAGARVERVLAVKFDGAPLLRGVPARELAQYAASSGDPSLWSHADQTLTLWPVPDRVAPLSVYAVLVPTNSAASLPDDLAEDFRSGIVALARADMMGNSPSMPYHNPQEAMRHGAIGLDEIVRAKRKQTSGNWTQLSVQPRPFV